MNAMWWINFAIPTCGYGVGLYLAYRHGYGQGWQSGFDYCTAAFSETMKALKSKCDTVNDQLASLTKKMSKPQRSDNDKQKE